MRTSHKAHVLPIFPVYSATFIADTHLVLGGGGGASKTGVKNKLRLYSIGPNKALDLLDEYELAAGEDAPMSMAVHPKSNAIICGVNSAVGQLEKGENENCRVFEMTDNKFTPLRTRGTLPPGNLDDYQKVTTLSPDGVLLAVAGSHDMALLAYPSLHPVIEPIHTDSEIYDVTLSNTTLIITTTTNLFVYSLPPVTPEQTDAEPVSLDLIQTIDIPPLPAGGTTSVFRSARFSLADSAIFYTIINSSSPRTRKAKTPQRWAFVSKWDTRTWKASITRNVGNRNLTCFDVSADGHFLAFGSSDLTIGFLDAATLNPLLNILKAHEFPPTTIAFSPTSTLLISGSADNSVRIITVPDQTSNSWSSTFLIFFLTILVLLLAMGAAKLAGNGRLL